MAFSTTCLLLVSLSMCVTSTPIYGQEVVVNAQQLTQQLCRRSVDDCIEMQFRFSVTLADSVGTWHLKPWQQVLWYWDECRKQLAPKGTVVNSLGETGEVYGFILLGDVLLSNPSPAEFHLADQKTRQGFLREIEHLAGLVPRNKKGKRGKPSKSLLALRAALEKAVPESTVSIADLGNKN